MAQRSRPVSLDRLVVGSDGERILNETHVPGVPGKALRKLLTGGLTRAGNESIIWNSEIRTGM